MPPPRRGEDAPCPFHGDRTREWRSPMVTLSETRYAPSFRTARHVHEGTTIAFVLAGGFEERVGSRALSCGPSALLLRPAGVEHDDAFAERASHCFNLELPAPVSAGPGVTVDVRAEEPSWVAARLVLAAREAPQGDPLPVECLVADLLAALQPDARPPPAVRLRRVVERIEDEIARPWSLRDLAREVDLHPVHLARVFRRQYGESIGQLVHRRRVALACRHLAGSSMPLGRVAQASGFADQAHLTRIFRRSTGLTPGRFRAAFALRSFKT